MPRRFLGAREISTAQTESAQDAADEKGIVGGRAARRGPENSYQTEIHPEIGQIYRAKPRRRREWTELGGLSAEHAEHADPAQGRRFRRRLVPAAPRTTAINLPAPPPRTVSAGPASTVLRLFAETEPRELARTEPLLPPPPPSPPAANVPLLSTRNVSKIVRD